jgi:Fis family transcriptional regulator
MNYQLMTMSDKENVVQPQFSQCVEEALTKFLAAHKAHLPNNLHNLAIQSIEKPLLKKIMTLSHNNQSQAAKTLGLNRATLRKKLIEYDLLDMCTGDH